MPNINSSIFPEYPSAFGFIPNSSYIKSLTLFTTEVSPLRYILRGWSVYFLLGVSLLLPETLTMCLYRSMFLLSGLVIEIEKVGGLSQ